MIALKSVKTLPATMLEVERDEFSGGGPELSQPRRGLVGGEPLVVVGIAHGPMFTY